MTPYKVLFYAPTVGRGGIHAVVERLTAGLAEYADPDEWQFAVLGQGDDEIHLPVRYPENWPFTQIEPGEKPPPYDFQWLMAHTTDFYAHLKRVAGDYDLIYCPSAWWTVRGVDWDIETPFVTNIADFAFDHMDMGAVGLHYKATALLIAERAAAVVFPSQFQREHAERHYGYPRTRVIPYCADFVVADYDPSAAEAARVRAQYGLPERYVLAFHAFGHKDPITIIRAQHYARTRSAHVPPLVIAGLETDHYLKGHSTNAHVREVQAVLRDAGATFGQDVFILGYVPDADIAGLHAGATVAVQASKSEGDVSGASYAAMLARTPLIHSRLPVYAERLGEDDDYALSFDVGHAAGLGEALIRVCENETDARERAERAFDWTRRRTMRDVVHDYLDVFRAAIVGEHDSEPEPEAGPEAPKPAAKRSPAKKTTRKPRKGA